MSETEHDGGRPAGPGPETALEGPRFDLSGGDPCLDFANTVENRGGQEPKELLKDYGDLLEWSVEEGVIPPEVGEALARAAREEPKEAAGILRRARVIREAVFEVFHAAATGESPPPKALGILNHHLPRAFRHLCLYGDESGYHWECEDDHALDRMLWPVVRSAADLLTSDRLDRVRVCSAESCDWLFVDQSRNRSRRWCDMSVCGNRSKVRRYREARRDS